MTTAEIKKPYVPPKCNVTARVTVVVEYNADSSWGGNCTLDQVEKQAAEEAIGYIRQRTEKDRKLTIIGDPLVKAVITKRTER